jgi:hypothetical protein
MKARWAGHVTLGRDDKYLVILVGKPEGKRPLEDPGEDGRIIFERILGK